MAWEVEAALRKMKNGKEAGKDQVNIESKILNHGDTEQETHQEALVPTQKESKWLETSLCIRLEMVAWWLGAIKGKKTP